MLSYEWLISIAAIISLLAVLTACSMCGCRKTVPKNDLLGLPGNVKLTNPEESLNHNYLRDNASADSAPIGHRRSCADITDAGRRATNTANRSLPDIPIDSERVRGDSGDTLWENNEANGDTCSELYATVEENKISRQPLVSVPLVGQASKASSNVAASDDGKSSDYSSLSQTDDSFSPYAQVKSEHPYDRLRKSEHPYAQVGSSGVPSGGQSVAAADNPVPPPRTRKSNSFNSDAAGPAVPPAHADIPAATAIAGRISASQELPYMTPPIPTPAMVSEPQTHFSGDSQDSSKGYTSISVREPLANIKAQTRRSRTQELADSLYATVSDDSEAMYAAIDDPQSVYTSGSETYAQIQPLVAAEPLPSPPSEPVSEGPHVPPQPPSVDSLKHVAQAHSRQASSSSAASSVANLGSPKPEKRQANSPLPPPPAGSPELYATVEKKSTREAASAAAAERSLEEMYAKVMKKATKGSTRPDPTSDATDEVETAEGKRRLSSVDSEREPSISEAQAADDVSNASMDMSSSRESVEIRGKKDRSDADADSTSSTATTEDSSRTDPSDSASQHPYHQLQLPAGEAYASVPYDPGYEVVQKPRRDRKSEGDPNYEELRPQGAGSDLDFPSYLSVGSDTGRSEPGYASIGRVEPGYEVVRSRPHQPSYASVGSKSPRGSAEPNYESVNHDASASGSDPNYETVRNDPNYETVSYSEFPADPPYERLDNEQRD